MPKLNQNERVFYGHVGSRIRQLRLSARGRPISQAELASELGVKQNTVSRWESGDFRPTMLDALEIARVFEVPVGSLFLEDEGQSLDERISRSISALSQRDKLETFLFIKIRSELNNYMEHQLREDCNLGAGSDRVEGGASEKVNPGRTA